VAVPPERLPEFGARRGETKQSYMSSSFCEERRVRLETVGDQAGESGGEGGIRTHGTVSRTLAFEASTFNHSVTSPATILAKLAGEGHGGAVEGCSSKKQPQRIQSQRQYA
jgi:hypothetical protein